MTESPRAKLTVRAQVPVVEQEIELDVIDARLPCRNFEITYKVAEVGQVSLTSEFLLRLIRILDGLTEAEATSFFAFSAAEMAYVVNSLEQQGYVMRVEGSLWLTEAGRSLFNSGSDEPQIYDVERRHERHGFDLVSLAPATFSALSRFDSELPELQPAEPDQIASASRLLPAAFRKHFDTIVRRRSQAPLKQSLYAIDDVTAAERFFTMVPIAVRARSTLAGSPEPSLSDRWTGYDLDDRSEVVGAAAALLKDIRVPQHFAGVEAMKVLGQVGKEALAELLSGGVVRRDALLREAVKRAGEFRSDRPTVPIVGTLFTEANRERLRKALDYARAKTTSPPGLVVWQTPALPRWGSTRRLPQTIEMIQQLTGDAGREPTSVAMAIDKAPWHLVHSFDAVVGSRAIDLGLGAMEILLVPNQLASVIVHTAVGQRDSYPVPLGIISFDPIVVDRTTSLLNDLLPIHWGELNDHSRQVADELRCILDKGAVSNSTVKD